jgi:hypothetical protein
MMRMARSAAVVRRPIKIVARLMPLPERPMNPLDQWRVPIDRDRGTEASTLVSSAEDSSVPLEWAPEETHGTACDA